MVTLVVGVRASFYRGGWGWGKGKAMREDVDFLKRGAHTKLSSRKRWRGRGASTSSFSEREGGGGL